MCSSGSCLIAGCSKLADVVDSNFESLYLFYVKVRSFISHHHESLNPIIKSKSLELVFASLLALYGRYLSFFITLLTVYPAYKLFAWTPVNEWTQRFKQLMTRTDTKLRLDEEIVEWVENQAYSDGIALYLSKSGIVRKFLGLIIAECEGEILWSLFQALLVCFISIYLVFWSTFIRNIMMSIFIYDMVHDLLFQSHLFHRSYYQRFQALFHSSHAHWSKLLVEMRLFVAIYIYIVLVSWICGSFGAGMSITFGSYLIVRNTVGNRYQSYTRFGEADSKTEAIHIGAWLFFFVLALIVQWRAF